MKVGHVGKQPTSLNGELESVSQIFRLYLAHRDGNQSGAEKDNRLLFREQYTLLFSKSKMAEVIFNQSGGELRIQDGDRGSETWKRGPGFP